MHLKTAQGIFIAHHVASLTLSTSVPLLMPPSMRRGTLVPIALRTDATMSNGAGLWSNCLPPWLDSTMPSTPASTALRASLGLSTPCTTHSHPSSCLTTPQWINNTSELFVHQQSRARLQSHVLSAKMLDCTSFAQMDQACHLHTCHRVCIYKRQ